MRASPAKHNSAVQSSLGDYEVDGLGAGFGEVGVVGCCDADAYGAGGADGRRGGDLVVGIDESKRPPGAGVAEVDGVEGAIVDVGAVLSAEIKHAIGAYG